MASYYYVKILMIFSMCNSAKGSDCGLVNVNIPTNGAEIGGAFGKSVILLCSNKYPLEKRNTLKDQEKFNNSVHREGEGYQFIFWYSCFAYNKKYILHVL